MTSTLNGQRATSVKLWLPAWGRWFAEVSIDGESAIAGAASLVIAGSTFSGTVLSGGPFKGRAMYRIVGGRGGWGRTVKARGYANDAGVKLSTVLRDVATDAGEQLDLANVSADTRLGPSYARPEGAARRVLELEAPRGWYVDEAGVTRIGRRPSVPFTGKATVETVDRARALVRLAVDAIAGLVPGAVVEGLEAVDVIHEVSSGGVRSTVWGKRGAAGSSRRLAALVALVEQADPDRAFRGVWEYRVVSLAGDRVDLEPLRASSGMPSLDRIPMRPGLAGSRSDLMLGSHVLVAFVDADPGRPSVIAFEDSEGEGFLPLLTEIDAATLVKLGQGVKPAIGAGDLAGGIWPCIPTQTKVLI